MIIAFSGKKGSGKDTCANFVVGRLLQHLGICDTFQMHGSELYTVKEGEDENIEGYFEINRGDEGFFEWAFENLYPLVRSYACATPIKAYMVQVMGLDQELVNGTQEDKNTLTKYMWEDAPVNPDGKTGPMSLREIMVVLGTGVMRKWNPDIWVENLARAIVDKPSPKYALITDIRFINEAEWVQSQGGVVIRLTRTTAEDTSTPETQLDQYDKFDYTIDNANMTIDEALKALDEIIKGLIPEINES